ncbi:MAG: hypothetical protein JSR46_02140 [Verrucomicrobia bacterium]|nr:hypothetical protein [Verrucomicrobiota bacterium]
MEQIATQKPQRSKPSFLDVAKDYFTKPTMTLEEPYEPDLTGTEKKQLNLVNAFKQGLQESTSGELAQQVFEPTVQKKIEKDPTFWESLATEAGTVTGDLPYLAAGATLGGIIGAPGGPIGATVGAGFGATALPAFLKESLRQYRDFQGKGNDLTFGEFLQRADKVANKTLNEGLFGVILGSVKKAMPLLEKTPGIGKLFTSKASQIAGVTAAEAGVATVVPAAAQGRLPEKEDFARALALFAGFNLAHLPSNVREHIQKEGQKSGLSPEQFAENYSTKNMEKIKAVAESGSKKAEPQASNFTTEKGSTYQVNEDGTTTRTKAARPEHPGEEGLQPKSEKTFYVTQEQANILGEVQTSGEKKRLIELPDGSIGMQYTEGPNAGKVEQRTILKPQTAPGKGMLPIELFKNGQAHFGNKITSMGQPSAKIGRTLDEAVSFEAKAPKPKAEPKTQFDLMRDVVDDLYPIKRFVESAKVEDLLISEDPYKLARLYRGWSGKADTFLEYRTFNPDTLQWKGPGLRPILQPVRNDLQGFSKYLVGKRAIELGKHGKETGIDLANAQAYVKEHGSKYEKPAQQLKKYQSDVLHYAEKSGLISPETRQLWETMNENYVPFQRVLEEPEGEFINARTMQPKQQFFELKGSKKPVIDPLESIIQNSYTLIRASEQNRVLQALKNFNEKYKGAKEFIDVKEIGQEEANLKNFRDFLKGEKVVDDDGVVRFFDNGKLQKLKVTPEVAEALKGIRTSDELNFIGRILNYPTRAVRLGAITTSPTALVKLGTIDQLEAFLYTDIGYIPYVDAAKGFFHAIKKDPLYYQWKAAGGDQSIATSLSRSFKQQKLHKIATGKNTFKNTFFSLDGLIRAVENVSKPLEESTRLGVFEKSLKRKGMTADDVRTAALEARDATLDFQRKGARTKLMAQAVPFFNAGIQGAAKFVEQVKKDPNLLPKAITAVTLPTLALYYANKDRKEFQELPQWERDAYWHFYVDLDNGETQHYRMPRPFELGSVFATVPERLAEYAYEKDPDSLKAIGTNLKDVFTPSVMPAALVPFYEVATNKKMFSGAPIESTAMKRLPAEERYGPFTSETAKKMAPILQKIPFVGEHASPIVIDEFLSAWTGGMGSAMVHYSEKALEKTGILEEKIRPEQEISDLPIFKVFMGKKGYSTQARSLKKFYDESDKIEQQYNAIRKGVKEGRESKIENPQDIVARHRHLQRVRKAFSKSWTTIRNVQQDNDPTHYTPAEKKILIDALIKDMVHVSRMVMEKEE